MVLSIAPLTASYPLMLTFAALFSHATVVLNSVAGDNVDFALAASGISPTIIVASSQSTINYHDRVMKSQQGLLPKLSHYWQNKSLVNGNMPKTPSFAPPGARQNFLSKLRILFIYHDSTDKKSPRMSTTALGDLRILLGARACYALTASGVAGAVCQTNMFDYRQIQARESHFGPPLSCVEILLTGDDVNLGGSEPRGKVRDANSSSVAFKLTGVGCGQRPGSVWRRSEVRSRWTDWLGSYTICALRIRSLRERQ